MSSFHRSFATSVGFLKSNISNLSLSPLTGALGVHVQGIDLKNATPQLCSTLTSLVDQYHVVVLPDQFLTPTDQLKLAKSLGVPEIHPIVRGFDETPQIVEIIKEADSPTTFGEVFHSDNSFCEYPSGLSILSSVQVPPYGNDTVFANMNMVYESLSTKMKDIVCDLNAIHTASRAYSMDQGRIQKYKGEADMKYEETAILNQSVSHPVVRSHLRTHLPFLYVNSMFATHFEGMTEEESQVLLQYLTSLSSRPEYQARVSWTPGQVAIWDNCAVQHIAVNDMNDYKRVMNRVTLAGEKPIKYTKKESTLFTKKDSKEMEQNK